MRFSRSIAHFLNNRGFGSALIVLSASAAACAEGTPIRDDQVVIVTLNPDTDDAGSDASSSAGGAGGSSNSPNDNGGSEDAAAGSGGSSADPEPVVDAGAPDAPEPLDAGSDAS